MVLPADGRLKVVKEAVLINKSGKNGTDYYASLGYASIAHIKGPEALSNSLSVMAASNNREDMEYVVILMPANRNPRLVGETHTILKRIETGPAPPSPPGPRCARNNSGCWLEHKRQLRGHGGSRGWMTLGLTKPLAVIASISD